MMSISSYLLPPLIGQWWFDEPFHKMPMQFFSLDTGIMFTLMALAFVFMLLFGALCVCCWRGFLDACCCCCLRCCGTEEADIKAQ